ncbi:MAG: histidine--tRNA ligase [Coxiella sp. RIFCSPHIGHO2_12_FULL_42_15]|nr:MAG: histidine--tRNA ligase [Coxiella sp. RIFCSPHIGHO2_12_FULL_42_15]
MSKSLQAVRGMNDTLPDESCYWSLLESLCRDVVARYGYQEIRFPIVESTALFKRSIGEATDIVEKEMYSFDDRNGDSLTLRPEGTAGCVRAGIEHGLFYNQIQRFWYIGPMFRHERPQKGRYRQFHQLGVEAYGMAGPDIDAEIILISKRLLQALGLLDHVTLQINSLGNASARAAYRAALVDYFTAHQDQLDEDSLRRLTTNPLRILDSKNPSMQALNAAAPKLLDYLDESANQHFKTLLALLDAAGVHYEVNPRLVRGLDYYSLTVFEWITHQLGAQGTVCAGGRYDDLVEWLGGPSTPSIGFACGLERLVVLLRAQQHCRQHPHVFMILSGEKALSTGLVLAEQLRDAIPSLKVEANFSGGSFKNQFKRADKSGATWAIVVGDAEIAEQKYGLKNLRDQSQQKLTQEAIITRLKENLSNG